jgi:tight adherence protein B
MSSAVLITLALALLCAAGALLILQRGAQRKEQASTERFIDSRMAPAMAGLDAARAMAGHASGNTPGNARVAGASPTRVAQPQSHEALHAPSPGAGWRERLHYQAARASLAFDHVMSRAGLANSRRLALVATASTAVLCLWAGREGGVLAAGVVLLACACFIYFVLSTRTNRRRQKIVRQLPSFLDGIVRLITLGNSVPAAFQGALQTTEAPLRQCLDHVSRLLRGGVEIDRALSQAAVLYGARELELVGAVLRLSVKYGGRADVMLDRMSTFMRDLEHAERELAAMSAETRMSAWVLALLPLGIGGFLILNNPRYFGAMWYDPKGRELVYLAVALQMVGAWLLYHLTRLRRA